ncbi:hypothetical protein ACFPVT_04270 [Corynebacterium choanae]|uniref:DUF2273 domain-containing protein n=1 Tax=Corynebacterium choanae TaxID=1862358 RepID=A0A3G6JBE5_9CORY|nr:hypothetical protein [Corynebacterium choanae]AZA14408.1 hypothetical protein CCHOA_10125 [Corynebacterium choanae]
MNNYTAIGLTVGIALAFAVILGGLPGFLWLLLFTVIGGLIGAHFDGRLDLGSIIGGTGRGGKG